MSFRAESLQSYNRVNNVSPILILKSVLNNVSRNPCFNIGDVFLIFSVNTNHESVAYRSFNPSKFEARGARKVTTGIN
jgi:hypothetical protein